MQTPYSWSASYSSEKAESRKSNSNPGFNHLAASPDSHSWSGIFKDNFRPAPAANAEMIVRNARIGGNDLAQFWANL